MDFTGPVREEPPKIENNQAMQYEWLGAMLSGCSFGVHYAPFFHKLRMKLRELEKGSSAQTLA